MKNKNNNQEEILRHSLAHILAAAILKVWPQVKFAIGPAIEDGFYYDFDFGEEKIGENHLTLVEEKMKEIIKKDLPFEKFILPIKEALAKERERGQVYKVELIKGLMDSGEKEVSYYRLGDFEDLCRGPHLVSSGQVNAEAFKLTKLAGAYWRGDEKNKMLTRIYGIAFFSQKELNEYLKRLAEADRRDHRRIGKEQKLFMTSDEVGQGLVMFLPRGAFIRRKLEDYMYEIEERYGYSYVVTPVLARGKMYEQSGHLDHYREDMYNPLDIEGEDYYLKPMNCPHHHIMYRELVRSYRDLPLRLADFGMIHRYERSGTLTGLIRTRNFSQNDAHIYCAKPQIKEELMKVLALLKEVYQTFKIKDYWFRLSLPDYSNKEKYGDIENREMWEYSAEIARQAMREFGAKFIEEEGEAAFYGPKIDIQIKNVFGKEDTIATVQVDFYMPERFNLSFVNQKGKEERPVIIHRAIMGSFERFMAFLIEQTAGAFPLWLAPIQVTIISVGSDHIDYCQQLANELKANNIRVEVDDANETVGNKIRKAVHNKIPYIIVIGDKEMESGQLAVRERGNKKINKISRSDFIAKLKEQERKKR
jgi:threonyl-tRNA synthetase